MPQMVLAEHQATEPPEGSPTDWFARGYEMGVIEGVGQGIREVVVLEAEIRALGERVGLLIRGMQERYGEAAHRPDRWQPHPMYLRGVEMFERRQQADAPTLQQQWAPEAADPPVEKPRRARRRKADPDPDPGPTLDLSEPMALAPDRDADLTDEDQMRRAAGRAWRA